MDKPTVPDRADHGLLIPGTDEDKRAREFLEAIRKDEEADPEVKRRRERVNAAHQARYDRVRTGRTTYLAGLQEQLICDARKYAESCLADASSPEDRLKITRQIWNDFIPRHPHRDAFGLQFGALHTAIWTEGYPSLEERAAECGQTREPAQQAEPGPKAELSVDGQAIFQTEAP